jgi:hypothetical protein
MLAGAAVVPVAACDLLQDSTPEPPPAPSADELLVDRLTSAIRRTRAVAAASAGAGRSLVAVHDAHLAALGAPAPSSSTSPTATATPAPRTTGQVRAAEVRLEARLTEAAGRAEDGDLARLLASMAASLAQHVAVLPGRAAR